MLVNEIDFVNNTDVLDTQESQSPQHPCCCELCVPGPVQKPVQNDNEDGDDGRWTATSVAEWAIRGFQSIGRR